METLDRITIDPRICLGQATIRGMRITVSVILKMLGAGRSVAEVRQAYPELEDEDIRHPRPSGCARRWDRPDCRSS